MSVQDERQAIVRENITELVRQLTGFKENEKNFRKCEHYAVSIIENHRYLSTNSHEVRRKLEGLQEKFRISNYGDYAKYLGERCEQIVQHPLCTQHYELDVHWSLLDFLFTMPYAPIKAMRHNKFEIDLTEPLPVDESTLSHQNQGESWKNDLSENSIEVENITCDQSDSELSEWSDDETCDDESSETPVPSPKANDDKPERTKTVSLLPFLPTLKPPQKASPFVEYDGVQAQNVLVQNVQHSWWLSKTPQRQHVPESPLLQANFALTYAEFLSESTNNLIPYKEPNMASEYSLLREILWMFNEPRQCAFFDVGSDGVTVRDNVSLPSTSATSLMYFLVTNIVPYLKKMATLKSFILSVYKGDEFPPKSVECYAANLKSLLQPVWDELLAYEQELITPPFNQSRTVVHFYGHFTVSGTFRHLEYLYELHQRVTLKVRSCPAHVITAYLLTGLMRCHREASETNEANAAISLFLTTVKIFCVIIDTWWLEGRLDDYQKEFLIERVAESDHNVRVRLFTSDKARNIYLPTRVVECIAEDQFFTMLQQHLLEAGNTLNLLYELNRISDLRVAATANRMLKDEEKFYDIFIKEVMNFVIGHAEPLRETATQSNTNAEATHAEQNSELYQRDETNVPISTAKQAADDAASLQNDEVDTTPPKEPTDERCDSGFKGGSDCEESCEIDALKSLTTNDEFLLMAFSNYLSVKGDADDDNVDSAEACKATFSSNTSALDILTALKRTKRMLPVEEIVLTTMSRLLKARTDFADAYVIKLYRDEFNILMHLRNLRRVLLLEASDLMYEFYRKLFHRMVSEKNWGNSVLLTSAFDDLITAKYPEMSSMFLITVTPIGGTQTNKVFKGIDELSIDYNCDKGLCYIITPQSIGDYNRVFRYLLRVKWSLMTIEKLSFPKAHRLPYAPFEMIDFLARRLQQIRFWMMYALQNIHFHLMTHVLQSMGNQLDEKITKCNTFQEMYAVHHSYLRTVCEHCFLEDSLSAIKLGVDMLMNLVFVLHYEWHSCINFIAENNPLAIDLDGGEIDPDNDYVLHNQIDQIESTYVRCHSYLANKLNHEVYVKQKSFLSGLSAAFNTSMPY